MAARKKAAEPAGKRIYGGSSGGHSASSVPYFVAPGPSGDTSGVIDTAVFAAIKATASASNPIVLVPRPTGTGTPYYVTALPQITPWFSIWSADMATTIKDVGAGSGTSTPTSCLVVRDDSFVTVGNTAIANHLLGRFGGFVLDGTSHTSTGRAGIEMGDGYGLHAQNAYVVNYTAANDIGWWIINRIGWLERARTTNCHAQNCTNHVVFDVGAGSNSHDYSDWAFFITAQPNQNGIVWQNGTTQIGGSFTLQGNFNSGAANTGTVLSIGADASTVTLQEVVFNVFVECDDAGLGNVGPKLYNVGANAFVKGTGNWGFLQTGTHAFQAGNLTPPQSHLSLSGMLAYFGATTSPDAVITTYSGPTVSIGPISGAKGSSTVAAGNVTLFAAAGDFYATTLANGVNTLILSGFVPNRPRSILVALTQPASGAAGTLSYAAPGTNTAGTSLVLAFPNVGNIAPALNAANGAVDVLRIWTVDGVTFFVERAGNNVVPQGMPGSIFIAGQWYPQISSTGTALQVVQNTAYAIPFAVGAQHTFLAVGGQITIAGTGGTLRFGVYLDNGAGYPGALVVDGGTTPATSPGAAFATISTTLPPGFYWLVTVGQGGTVQPTVNTVQAGAGASPLFVFGSASAGGATNICGYALAAVTGALPATFTAGATTMASPPLTTAKA